MVLLDWYGLLRGSRGYEVQPAATEDDVVLHEERLGTRLPLQLRKLYLVSDGVYYQQGRWFVLWPLATLSRRNEQLWAEGGERSELLTFGDDGTGGYFCVPRNGNSGVFLWSSLAGAPCWIANDVGDFWVGWTTGTIGTYASAA
jgi:cell wall assembly regulator SMI1